MFSTFGGYRLCSAAYFRRDRANLAVVKIDEYKSSSLRKVNLVIVKIS
jgi:hypothetical protein